jgi:hypothetical protein
MVSKHMLQKYYKASLQVCQCNSRLNTHLQNVLYQNYIHSKPVVEQVWLTWSDNKVCELIAVEVLHTSLLNITVTAFEVLPLGSYAPMPAPSPPFKTILELVLWNVLQRCRCIKPDVIKLRGFESASELYRLSDHHWSAKLVPTLADRGCRVVSATNPSDRNFDSSRPGAATFPFK